MISALTAQGSLTFAMSPLTLHQPFSFAACGAGACWASWGDLGVPCMLWKHCVPPGRTFGVLLVLVKYCKIWPEMEVCLPCVISDLGHWTNLCFHFTVDVCNYVCLYMCRVHLEEMKSHFKCFDSLSELESLLIITTLVIYTWYLLNKQAYAYIYTYAQQAM